MTSGPSARHAIPPVAAALAALRRLVLAHGAAIETIDVNPLLVGAGVCIAVDALIIPSAKPLAPPPYRA